MSTSLRIRAEESEDKREKMALETPPEEEEGAEGKEEPKDRPLSKRLLPNNPPPPKLEHVIYKHYFVPTSIPYHCFRFFHYFP
jgi:hypothetical protein